jgi:hypothetical protein
MLRCQPHAVTHEGCFIKAIAMILREKNSSSEHCRAHHPALIINKQSPPNSHHQPRDASVAFLPRR